MKKYQDKLEKIEKEYYKNAEKIAFQAYNEYFLPYLKKNNLEFMTGNGTIIIYDRKNNHYLELDELPLRIQSIVTLETIDKYSILFLMPYYEKEG